MALLATIQDIQRFEAVPIASYVRGATLIADGGQYLKGTGVLNTAPRALLAPS